MIKKIFFNQIAAILGLAAIATLKQKNRDGNKVFHHFACFKGGGGIEADRKLICAPRLI